LAVALRAKQALLLLDNAEHLLPGAAQEIGALRAAVGPVILVTTRERLQLDGEHVYPVPSLQEDEGIELFLARARGLDPDFKANGSAAELCSHLDNLPLAIELAAARTPLFTPEQLVARLSERLDLLKAGRDADPRQQTLRATIEWSHDLLGSEEQGLFRCLSVFVGGCTFEAAEDVCGADPDTLQSLLDKNLVRRRDTENGPRYWMLETIREFAAERLAQECETDGLQRRYAEWIERTGEQAEAAMRGPHEQQVLDRLDLEHANISAALTWAAPVDDDLTARIVGSLQRWWTWRGLYAELERWAEPLLEREVAASPRAKVLSCLIAIAVVRPDAERLQSLGEELLPLSRSIGSEPRECQALFALGSSALLRGDVARGRKLYQETIELARTALPERVPLFLGDLGWLLRSAGEFAEARELLDEALELERGQRNPYQLAVILTQRAHLSLDEGEFPTALTLYREALEVCRESKLRRSMPICLSGISTALAGLGRGEEATRIGAAADRLLEEILSRTADEDDDDAELRERLGERRHSELRAEGRALSEEDAIELAISAANSKA
jgi:predicted ATPase